MAKRAGSSKRNKSVFQKNVSVSEEAAALSPVGDLLSVLEIEQRAVDQISPNPRNARTHSDRQIHQVAASILKFGFLVPIIVDETGMILAGHCRLEAAKKVGHTKVPTVVASHLTPLQKRAFVLAENRLAELAGWDEEILAAELSDLVEFYVDLDLGAIGYTTADVDALTVDPQPRKDDPDDLVDELESIRPAVTRQGDIWLLDYHKIICGDATENAIWKCLLTDETVDLAFTDPPYNVPIDGHVTGLGKVKHREFAMASGEMTSGEFERFLHGVIGCMISFSRDGAIHYICMDWRHQWELMGAARPQYKEYKNLCVWNKTNAGMGTFYRSQHELVHVFKVGTAAHINNFKLGQNGRYRTNVWTHPGVNTFKRDRDEELESHPTVKPVSMIAEVLLDCSEQGDIILDPFGGSGTTLIAAARTKRRARLIEIDPIYVDATVRRYIKRFRTVATLLETGETFDEVAERRFREELRGTQSNGSRRLENATSVDEAGDRREKPVRRAKVRPRKSAV